MSVFTRNTPTDATTGARHTSTTDLVRPVADPAPYGCYIDIQSLGMRYPSRTGDGFTALQDVSLQVRQGEFCVIVGPSGCGKSTLLNVLAGLVNPTSGTATIGGVSVGRPRNDIGFVFQTPTLLPWSTILDNVLLPMRVQRRGDRQKWRGRALELLEMTGLREVAGRYPAELSGGMQQRVGVARALMHNPTLLLMDEPFGALDALTRETMNMELQRVWMTQQIAVVFVTHGISEAVLLGDRVVVMGQRPGRVLADMVIDLPRPRTLDMAETPAFTAYARQIRALLHARTET